MREKKSNRTAVVLGATAGLISLLVHSFTDFNMHIPANAFTAVALLAIVTSHIRFATERYWFTARWPLATIGSVALIAILCILSPMALVRTREQSLVNRAERIADGKPEKIALLKRAFELQPTNFHTAYAIAEQLRALAWTGINGNEDYAREALDWYRRDLALNKWSVAGMLGAGMCLDWLGRHDEARGYFEHALRLDPNHYHSRAMMGWHEFQLENYPEARAWMLKSMQVYWMHNPLARTYLTVAERRIQEQNLKTTQPKQ